MITDPVNSETEKSMKNKRRSWRLQEFWCLRELPQCYIQNRDKKGGRSIGIIGGADGPTKIFLAGKIGSPDEETKAAVLDLETAKSSPMGMSWNLTM